MTTTEATAEAARIMTRIKAQYAAHTLLPRCDGMHVFPCEEVKTGHCVCAHQHGYTLNLNQLQRLYRAVCGEFIEPKPEG